MTVLRRFLLIYCFMLLSWMSFFRLFYHETLLNPSLCCRPNTGFFLQINNDNNKTTRKLEYIFNGNLTVPMNSERALCEFQLQDAYSFHFPHAMQTLYRCWSWWKLHDNKTPVLVFPRNQIPDNPFLLGFIQSLQDSTGLQVIKPNQVVPPTDYAARPRVPPNIMNPNNTFELLLQDPPYYAFYQPSDAKVLRDTIRTRATMACPTSMDNEFVPRIAILNRHKNRQLLNAKQLVSQIQQTVPVTEDVPIMYFEDNVSFVAQTDFMASVDILVSPHGAQLTGIAFLPDCGAVLEIFPPGYYLPSFFGSLARASSLHHGFVVLTKTGNWRPEAVRGMQTRLSRQRVRNKPLCPDIAVVLEGIQILVSQWKSCCWNQRNISTS